LTVPAAGHSIRHVRFAFLGPLEVVEDQLVLTPSAPKPRQLLAGLVLQANHIVPVDRLIEELWDGEPPASARTTLHTYVYQLRRSLAQAGPAAQDILRTKSGGYLAAVEPESVDTYLFDRHMQRGQLALERGEPAVAAGELNRALGLWRGTALADVVTGAMLGPLAVRLGENRLRVLEMRVMAELSLGRHRELVSELKELVSAHPLHENLYAQLMLALHRSGRRFEAMHIYRQLRQTLVEELGLEPSAELMRLHRAILADDPALDLSTSAQTISVARAPGTGDVNLAVALERAYRRLDAAAEHAQRLLDLVPWDGIIATAANDRTVPVGSAGFTRNACSTLD
jgi:DNA-binding SARP family transcriptional activator